MDVDDGLAFVLVSMAGTALTVVGVVIRAVGDGWDTSSASTQ